MYSIVNKYCNKHKFLDETNVISDAQLGMTRAFEKFKIDHELSLDTNRRRLTSYVATCIDTQIKKQLDRSVRWAISKRAEKEDIELATYDGDLGYLDRSLDTSSAKELVAHLLENLTDEESLLVTNVYLKGHTQSAEARRLGFTPMAIALRLKQILAGLKLKNYEDEGTSREDLKTELLPRNLTWRSKL
jgi:RNA polymerase sigma factor (sigma-70 family)